MPTSRPPTTAARAGLLYFALVFALGFVLGTVRTLAVADAPGGARLAGVLLELPFMLAASWFLSGFVVRRCGVAPTLGARAIMGGIALALLLVAEALLGTLLFGRSLHGHLALYGEPSYALGLAAQVVFGAIPVWRLRSDRRRASTTEP
jgi:hypothetical protein